MTTNAPTRLRARTPPSGPAPLFGVFLILWIAFAAALIFSQESLDGVWEWLTGLPLIAEVVLWIVLLPLVLALWIWESDWDLWLRLLLIIVIALVNISMMSPKPGVAPKERPEGAYGDSRLG